MNNKKTKYLSNKEKIKVIAEWIHFELEEAPPKLSGADIHTLQLQAVETNDKEWFDQLSELKAQLV